MVNDAVAIILFRVVGGLFDSDISEKNIVSIVFSTLGLFILDIFGSLAIGTVIGTFSFNDSTCMYEVV